MEALTDIMRESANEMNILKAINQLCDMQGFKPKTSNEKHTDPLTINTQDTEL